jgi:hypothetical protein
MDQSGSNLKIAIAVVSTVLSACIIGSATMLISKLDSLSESSVRIETIALFHKEKIDEVAVRLGVLESKVMQIGGGQ